MEEELKYDMIRAALFGLISEQVRQKLPALKKGENREEKILEFALDILQIIAREASNSNANDWAEEIAEYFST